MMPRFAANLTMMFNEVPFLDRFAAAAAAGFRGVEFLFPYEHDPVALREELDRNGLKQALFNLPPGDWAAGDRGIAALPGREAEFEASVETALRYADALGCPLLHVMAGIVVSADAAREAENVFVRNLKVAAAAAATRGIGLVIEPINPYDMPGYFLSGCDQARAIIDRVGADNLGLQLDLYHRQMTEGRVARAIADFADITRHVQIANPPHRRDPGDGELNFPYLFEALAAAGYDGWIGCEYLPAGATLDSLHWFDAYRDAQ